MLSLVMLVVVTALQDVELQPGLKISFRADAKFAREIPPPENLARAVAYRDKNWVLLINVGKPDGRTCDSRLKAEKAQFDQVKNSRPEMSAMMKFDEVSVRKLGGTNALFSRGRSRSAAEAKADQPFREGASSLVCTKKAYVNLTLNLLQGALTEEQLVELNAIAESIVEK